jgi:hypothetical protein
LEIRKLGLWLGVAPALLAASTFAACGGDDDDGGGGTGSDEDFVADFCELLKNFGEDIDKLEDEADSITDLDEIAELLSEPVENLADGFADLKPPADLRDWHKEASDQLKEAAEQLKDGNLDADILASDSPIPDPPEDAADRLSAIAEDNEDCQDAEFGFGS